MASPESVSTIESAPLSRRVLRPAIEHYDTAAIRKVPLERWKVVLNRAMPEQPSETIASIDGVAELFTSRTQSPQLRELRHVLQALGTAAGGHAFNEAGVVLGVDRSDWPPAVEELAVEVWARALDNPQYERILEFAEIALHDRETDLRCKEFVGRAGGPLHCDIQERARLEENLLPWFVKEGMGHKVVVRAYAEADRHVLCISHGSRVQRESTVEDDGAEAVITFRPLTCDVVSYEHSAGRLRISARTNRQVDSYRRAVGTVFRGDPEFFTERQLYALAPIVDAIRGGSLPSAPIDLGIHSVTLVGCVWCTGGGIVHRIYGRGGRDCVGQARRASFQPEHDELTQATLAFFFSGAKRPERVDVVIREGNALDFRKPHHRDAIEGYLEHVGIRLPRAQPERPRPVSQLRGIQSADIWRQALGEDMVKAVDAGILVRAATPAIGSGSRGSLRVVDSVSGSEALVVDDGALTVLGPDALASYVLDERRLGDLIREDLMCTRSLGSLPIEGVYDLGPAEVGTVHMRPFLVTRFIDDPAALERLLQTQRAAQETVVTIHLPNADLAKWTSGFPLDGLAPPFRVRRRAVRVLRVEDQVPALELAGEERLVVDTRRHTAWLDGVLLDLTEGERGTLEILAKESASGRNVPAGELSTLLGGPNAGNEVAKQRVQALRKAIRDCMKSAGKDCPTVVRTATRRGEGYSLAMKPYLV